MMKKTIIALMALAGVAAAAEHSLTTGILYTPNGGETILVDGFTTPSYSDLGYQSSYWPGSKTLSSLNFSITLADLYGASAIATSDIITMTSLKIKVCGAGWCQDGGRTITLSTGTYSYTVELEDVFTGVGGNEGNVEGYLTLTPENCSLTKASVLNVSIKPDSSKTTDTLSVATADIYGKNDATVQWSGVSEIDIASTWGKEAPLIQLNVVTAAAVPEPTTATLSLLALAGLAARRRRK